MIFLIAVSLGLCVGKLRSAFLTVVNVFAIIATFASTILFSSGHISYLDVLIAVLGYNVGLISVLVTILLVRRPTVSPGLHCDELQPRPSRSNKRYFSLRD